MNLKERATELNTNQKQILDTIWRLGPISRAEIAEKTGLTSMMVSRLARGLEDRELVLEAEKRTGKVGYPSKPLLISPQAGFAFGVDLSHKSLEIVAIDLSGSVVADCHKNIVQAEIDEVIAAVDQFISSTIASKENPISASAVLGLGVSIPSDFAKAGRIPAPQSTFSHFRHRDLMEEIKKRIDLPLCINSDSNAAAVAERLVGVGRNYDHFIQLFIGHGVGAGLVINGQPYFGPNRNAGIIGSHFPYNRPRPSALDFLETIQKAGVEVEDFVDLHAFDPLSFPETRTWVTRAGQQLREALLYAVRLLDTQAVIVGGRLPGALHQALAIEIDRPDFCAENEVAQEMPRPRVLVSSLGARAGAIGAAALPIYESLFGA